MTKTLILTVGLPRCGKSTWSKQQGVPMVNKDSIRLALHGTEFIEAAEPMVHTIAKYMVESLFRAGHDTVILDETNMDKATRAEWKSPMWERRYQTFPIDPDLSKERAVECEARGEFFAGYAAVMSEVIDRKASKYEPVEIHEWDHNSI